MSIPYIPGWGDTLKNSLPELGKNLHKIIKPHAESEQRLKRMLEEDPEKINEFIQTARTNPGVLSNVFGKGAEEYIAQQDFTPDYKRRQEGAELTLQNARVTLEENQAQAKLRAERDAAFQAAITRPGITPEEIQFHTAKRHGLTTADDYENQIVQRRVNDLQLTTLERDASLREYFDSPEIQTLFNDPNKPMTPQRLTEMMASNSKLTEAIWTNPALAKHWMDQINNMQQEAMQRRLQAHQYGMLNAREDALTKRQEEKAEKDRIANIARISNLRDRIAFNLMSGKIKPEDAAASEQQLNTYQAELVTLGQPPAVWRIRPESGEGWFGPPHDRGGLEVLDPVTGQPISAANFMQQRASTGEGLSPEVKANPQAAIDAWKTATDEEKAAHRSTYPLDGIWLDSQIQPVAPPNTPPANRPVHRPISGIR